MRFFLTLAAALFASGAHAAPQGLELYGRLPTIEQIEISPDGSRLAMVTTDGEARSVIIRGTGPASKGIRSPAGNVKVRNIVWVGSKDLIVSTSKTATTFDVVGGRREWTMAFDMNANTGELRRMLDTKARESTASRGNVRDALNVIAGSPIVMNVAGQPKTFLRGLSVQGTRYVLTLYRDDLNGGRPWLIEAGTPTTADMVVGPDGKVLAEKRIDSAGRWSIRLRTTEGAREILTGPGPSGASMMGTGRTPDAITVSAYDENGDVGIYEYGPEGRRQSFGEAGSVGAIYDPAVNLLIGTSTRVGDEVKTTFFNDSDQKAWDAVIKAFSGAGVTRTSWSNDRRKIVVRVDSPIDGPAYSLVDLDAKKAEWLALEYEGLNPDLIASVRPIAFKAQDGLQLSGYLFLPHDSNGKNLPLVVLPHGGPETRDYPGYDWLAQGIASRGYAVLKVNFRGSTGLGKAFRDAGESQWGRKMQTDLSDGVRYLATQGVIDPKRACIVGASYGGYAALAGATIDKGVYRCAVSYGGISDLPQLAAHVKETSGERSSQLLRLFIGADRSSDAVLAERSPALLAAKADIPVLLIHGKDDTVVPLAQSQAMQTALNKAGKPTDLIVLDGEDHWLTSGATRLKMLKATMAFVEKNNPPN
jgi:dipeptidyl aminopeptidase/acylaminoacyl peptidase